MDKKKQIMPLKTELQIQAQLLTIQISKNDQMNQQNVR